MIRAGADLGPGVLAGFTSSAEGNLGLHVGDVAGSVADRRRALAAALGVPVLFARQVHGATARSVDDLDPAVVRDAAALDLWPQDGADALVTTRADRGLGVLVADCVPVLLADPAAPVVAVAHAGRVGLLDGVLSGVLEAMRIAGAETERIRAALGPSAGPCCYEVPAEMAEHAVARIPAMGATTRRGTAALDLRAGCRAVLTAAGVRDVVEVGGCTIEDESLFSHRRAGGRPMGRFAGVVRLLP